MLSNMKNLELGDILLLDCKKNMSFSSRDAYKEEFYTMKNWGIISHNNRVINVKCHQQLVLVFIEYVKINNRLIGMILSYDREKIYIKIPGDSELIDYYFTLKTVK